MSLESLTSLHTVSVYRDVPTIGDGMGASYSSTLIGTKLCNVQRGNAVRSRASETAGVKITHTVYFSADPSLDSRNVLKFGSLYLRVIGCFPETNGVGDDKVWVCPAEQDDNWREPSAG